MRSALAADSRSMPKVAADWRLAPASSVFLQRHLALAVDRVGDEQPHGRGRHRAIVRQHLRLRQQQMRGVLDDAHHGLERALVVRKIGVEFDGVDHPHEDRSTPASSVSLSQK